MIADEPALTLELARRHYGAGVGRIEAALREIFPPGFAERVGPHTVAELAETIWRYAMMACCCPAPSRCGPPRRSGRSPPGISCPACQRAADSDSGVDSDSGQGVAETNSGTLGG